jgi:hypothetical protein
MKAITILLFFLFFSHGWNLRYLFSLLLGLVGRRMGFCGGKWGGHWCFDTITEEWCTLGAGSVELCRIWNVMCVLQQICTPPDLLPIWYASYRKDSEISALLGQLDRWRITARRFVDKWVTLAEHKFWVYLVHDLLRYLFVLIVKVLVRHTV